jgi:hypothetical protein
MLQVHDQMMLDMFLRPLLLLLLGFFGIYCYAPSSWSNDV